LPFICVLDEIVHVNIKEEQIVILSIIESYLFLMILAIKVVDGFYGGQTVLADSLISPKEGVVALNLHTSQFAYPLITQNALGLLPGGVDDHKLLHLGNINLFDCFSVLGGKEEEHFLGIIFGEFWKRMHRHQVRTEHFSLLWWRRR